jgi:glycosyl transferase family 25
MANNIDKIIYINLDKHVEKKTVIENQLRYFDLPFERFSGINNPYDGIGCAQSHLAVLKMARDNRYKNVLILEDDFVFTVTKDEFENAMTKLFTHVPDFDVCMLSYNLQKGDIYQEHPFLLKNIEAQTASAYLVNHTIYDDLINLYEESNIALEQTRQHWIYAIDMIWKPMQLLKKWYCFSHRMGKQSIILDW